MRVTRVNYTSDVRCVDCYNFSDEENAAVSLLSVNRIRIIVIAERYGTPVVVSNIF